MTRPWKTIARTLLAGGLVGTAVLAGPVPGAAAWTAPAPPTRADAEPSLLDLVPAGVADRMTAQIPLVDAAGVLRTAVERGDATGYAGIGLVDDHVTLWWKGELPGDVATAVTRARRTAPVEVAAATYSQAELRAAAATLAPAIRDSAAKPTVRLRTDGAGLEVAVPGTPSAARLPKLPATGVRTSVVQGRPMLDRSREDDAAPWTGGARIWNGGVICSSAFGARHAGTGAGYLLTAAHCSDLGVVWTTGTGTAIGPAVQKSSDHDAMLISTPSPGGDVYVGGSNDEVRARVVGWTEVFPGQLLCQSGATSAWELSRPICNFRVEFHYEDREDLVEATQLDGEEAARGGDSGGPVYAVNPDGTLLAAGTVTRSGGPGLGFQDFATYRDDFGDIVPVTGTASTTCRISYAVTDSWSGGFAASVTVHNSGPAITGWSLRWSFPGNQVVQGRWHGQFQQTGPAVLVTNEAHNATIPAGGSVNLGFTASGSPVTPVPFTLNGGTCS